MDIQKVKGQYNTYKIEISWGQLEAIRDALALHHADPLSDEMYEELAWWMSGNIPLPGEDKSEKEKEEEREQERKDAEGMAADGLELPDVPEEAFGKKDEKPKTGTPGGASAPKGPEAPEPKPEKEPATESLKDKTPPYGTKERTFRDMQRFVKGQKQGSFIGQPTGTSKKKTGWNFKIKRGDGKKVNTFIPKKGESLLDLLPAPPVL